MPTTNPPPDRIAQVRDFNRFYTRRIGVLHEGLQGTRFTLAESRLLWELAHRSTSTAAELSRELELDAGYLSRLLRRFKERGLIKATRSQNDARHLHLELTAAGRRAFAPLDSRSQAETGALLARLADGEQRQLLHAMAQVRHLLGDARRRPPLVLRPHRPGDIGWVVSRHGALYAKEYHWDQRFEAMVARIAAEFIDRFDPKHEACWIAERDGVPLGSVFLVQARDDADASPLPGIAQLRMLLIEPEARGLGLGARLVAECERFARHAGYGKIMLWTHSTLVAARHIYARSGYRLVASQPYKRFGHDLVSETWELALD